MRLTYHYLRPRLMAMGFWPTTKVALVTWYLLGLDILLFVLQKTLGLLRLSFGQELGGWVSFLSFAVIVLLLFLGARWLKARLLWRLRNRLIVTYMFIGVIPVVLLVTLALLSFYLFAGQFATFIVTTGLNSELQSLDAANSAIAHELAARLQRGAGTEAAALEGLRKTDRAWADRQVCVWLDGNVILNSSPTGQVAPPGLPPYLKASFRNVVRDHDKLFLRAAETIPVGSQRLTVLSSEPLDQHLIQDLAANLGEVTLYASGLSLHRVEQPQGGVSVSNSGSPRAKVSVSISKPEGQYVLDTGNGPLVPTYNAGAVPPPTRSWDRTVTFATSVFVVSWENGDTSNPAAITVQTRVSKLYERLFAALGDFAPAIEFFLLIAAITFAVIELIALFIGTRLTRTVTAAVAELYNATGHINRGDFSHRIPVKSKDQIAALSTSFNSMTASLEKLIEEQKEKQRMENELVIAQEVQAQLFPRHVSQLAALEVYGFCRPARTVSGDYYDFLNMDSERLLLAVGDISGKGISAALLMATIHSAVRAYSLEALPALCEPVAAGAGTGSSLALPSQLLGAGLSPGTLLSLLNHQLYQSTPMEKYATLFLGIYNATKSSLVYSNGGHLPPIVLGCDGTVRRLDRGGTVIGLFDNMSYEEGSVQLYSGEIFLAYSDGVTEPENDFGEFGEQRLIDLVRENRQLSLERITEVVTAAVDDWIGANEQPDDVTLVLARAA